MTHLEPPSTRPTLASESSQPEQSLNPSLAPPSESPPVEPSRPDWKTFLKKSGRRLNLKYFGDRIIVGIFFAIVPTTISTYINRQNYYDQVVNDYLQDLRQYVVTDKIAIEKGKSELKIDLSQGARELMHSKTTNSLVKLNEKASLLGISDVPLLSKFPFFQDNNIRRRAILFNVLRNSGLGFTSRTGDPPVDENFLTGIEISDDSSDYPIALQNTDLTLAHLNQALFVKVDLTGSRFNYATLKDAYFNHSLLKEVNFYGADLTGVRFIKTDLQDANFTKSQLANADFKEAQNISLTELQAQEAFLCNTTLPSGEIATENCRRADLSNQSLTEVDFTDVSLAGANLMNTDLTNAKGIMLNALKEQDAIVCNTTLPNGQVISVNCDSE